MKANLSPRPGVPGEMQTLLKHQENAKIFRSDDDSNYQKLQQSSAKRRIFVACAVLIVMALAVRSVRSVVQRRRHNTPSMAINNLETSPGGGTSLPTIINEESLASLGDAIKGAYGDLSSQQVPWCGPFCGSTASYPPRVPPDVPGVPAYKGSIGSGVPIRVAYDERSVLIDGKPALLLSGSLHPVRATPVSWARALDQAVHHNLNMVTIYIMWSAHQPFEKGGLSWRLPFGGIDQNPDAWTLASAIHAAADRGLFVHIRIGPYVCAEYSYGGIPEWVPLHSPNMAMRRPNREWMDVMESFVTQAIDYITTNQLWAHQGGPIILGQIENEIGGSMDPRTEKLMVVDENGWFYDPDLVKEAYNSTGNAAEMFRNATLQDYADWCGNLVQRLAPNVTWTMCSGLSAPNTISTCNGECSTWWLEEYGASGRIQKDHPPMLTEFEGGYQIWGEKPASPTDYFWGNTARNMTYQALQWFARGGTHLNYYMWWGGYNRGRAAGAGIANMYAAEAPMCPSGERRLPKWGHYQALHRALISVAPTLLEAKTALTDFQFVHHLDENGDWVVGPDQRIYEYHVDKESYHNVMFLENDAIDPVTVRLRATMHILYMAPQSALLIIDGAVVFDSSKIDIACKFFSRVYSPQTQIPRFLNWLSWSEPIGASSSYPLTNTTTYPIEQTLLNIDSGISSDYAWFETSCNSGRLIRNATISIDTQSANAFTIYVDDAFVGAANQHLHSSELVTLKISIGDLLPGERRISLLSESLGYHNLIGRWGADTKAKTKGITGNVTIAGTDWDGSPIIIDLIDGTTTWRSFPGLHDASLATSGGDVGASNVRNRLVTSDGNPGLPTWSSTLFYTPPTSVFDAKTEHMYLHLTLGRGHLWLNGYDLGRYWNITQSDDLRASSGPRDRGSSSNNNNNNSPRYTQEYYLLPSDLLSSPGNLNKLVLFDTFGSDHRHFARLVKSSLVASSEPLFEDEVDFGDECLE